MVVVAALLRLIVMLGYPPAMFFNDSFNYLTDAYTKTPDTVRSDGYPLFLYLLLPFHSLNVVTGLQALMGLAMGVGIYAVLRRRGLPWWGATIPALPVLFDVFELQLEHMIAADVLFYAIVTLVLVLLCWWDRPPLWVAVLVGLATGYATTVRTVGEPLLVLVVIGMLLRKMGWRRVAATFVAGVLPILGYVIWFHSIPGTMRSTSRTGPSSTAGCSPSPTATGWTPRPSCACSATRAPLADRPSSQEYLWSDDTPLAALTGNQQREPVHPADQLADDEVRRARDREAAARLPQGGGLGHAADVPLDAEGTNDVGSSSAGNLEGSGSKFRFESAAEESVIEATPGWVTKEPATRTRPATSAAPITASRGSSSPGLTSSVPTRRCSTCAAPSCSSSCWWARSASGSASAVGRASPEPAGAASGCFRGWSASR